MTWARTGLRSSAAIPSTSWCPPARRAPPPAPGRGGRPGPRGGEPLLLLRDGHCLRAHALDACGFRDPASPLGFEATSLHTLVQMVDNGVGITLLPQVALDAGLLKN